MPRARPGDRYVPRCRLSRLIIPSDPVEHFVTDPILNALSVDVEDYYQVSAFEKHVPRERWEWYPCRVVANTQRMLELLDRHRVKATFFVLGWTARAYPDLVREIAAAGHELGSHSYWHRLVYEQTPDEFRADLIDARSAIEDAAGRTVTTYRAPSFSITERSVWALEILAEEGVSVDSSIYPIYHDRYGMPDSRVDIHEIQTASGKHFTVPGVSRLGFAQGKLTEAHVFWDRLTLLEQLGVAPKTA